ncbi:MAG: PQQ-binding-like beta-propeller repeat protein [Acidobacteria bacterium]|nr:PQQ-binding-like beta-propeller repeat protein [Acidobacteriota bacterium]
MTRSRERLCSISHEKPNDRSSLSRGEWQLWIVIAAVIALMTARSVLAGSGPQRAAVKLPLHAARPVRTVTAPALAKRDLGPYRATRHASAKGEPHEINETNAEIPWRLQRAKAPERFEDPALERPSRTPRPNMPAPAAGFPANGNAASVLPPDPQGAVGERYYVQWVNLQIDIFDKATGASAIGGPVDGNAVWAPLGGDCAVSNNGDPIVLYDHLARRWFLAQLTFTNHVCIAVSRSADPVTSGWYLYDYLADAGVGYFPDAPKYGVWPDGYYMSANMFSGSSFVGAQFAVFERSRMLAGDASARMLYGYADAATNDWAWALLPSDLDGPAPAAGEPNHFLTFYDDAWGEGHSDELLLFDLSVDWSTGSGSFTGPTTIDLAAAGYAFDSNLCGYNRNCIPQPGTAQGLDALASRLMYRLQYRSLGGTPTLVVTHAVDVNGSDHAGVRWYELQNAGGGWAVAQAGSYAPDADDRWSPSAALDAAGDLAVGFTTASGATYPTIRWAGRLVSDPPGSLAQGEATVVAGAGSQTSTSARWGDYSTMSVDPVDDCTFWYTSEYLDTTSPAGWKTWVASFKFNAGVAPTGLTASVGGNNGISLSWNAVSGASGYGVYRGGKAGGPYVRLATTPAGTTGYLDATAPGDIASYYVVTAFFGGACDSGYSNEVSATPPGTCDLPPIFAGIASASSLASSSCGIQLSWSAASPQCGGPVTYAVYRSTDPYFTPSLSNRLAAGLTGATYTDHAGLVSGTTYHYIVRALDQSNGQEDPNQAIASAQAAGPPISSVLYSEDFESYAEGDMAGWSTGVFNSGDANDWRGVMSCTAHSGSRIFRAGGTSCTRNYGSNKHAFAGPPPITVPAGATNVRLSFWHRWQLESGYDGAYLRLDLGGGSYTYLDPGVFLANGYNNPAGAEQWWSGAQSGFVNTVVDLDAACRAAGAAEGCAGSTLHIAFVEYTDGSVTRDGWFIDDVQVTAEVPGPCGGASGGTPEDVQYFTARATSGQVKLEWLNPSSGPYGATKICRSTTTYPDAASCTPILSWAGALNTYDASTDSGLANGTAYYYTAFVEDSAGNRSTGRHLTARPLDTSGKILWAYSSGATSLAPTGVMPGAIGTGGTWAVSNDRVLHAMNPASTGGDWPRSGSFSWTPLAMNGPAQARPPVVPTSVIPGHSLVTFLGSEDGHTYAADAHTGQLLWQSPALGSILLASPAGIFTDFGGADDLLFVGSRDAGLDNLMYLLDPTDGHIIAGFDNGGGAGGMGIISSSATVDYATNRIFFASRSRAGGSQDTLWCLQFTAGGFTKVWSKPYGDIDGAPVLLSGRLYVGNNAGVVYAVDPANGAEIWDHATGDGAVKGFIWPQYTTSTPRKLYFSTTNTVWALTDDGSSASLTWSTTAIPAPSIPLAPFGGSALYVGSSDGRLYQLDAATGGVDTSVTLGDGSATIGSPAMDVVNNMAYVGSESGAVYGVALPLQ